MFLTLNILKGPHFNPLEDIQRNVMTVQKGLLENKFSSNASWYGRNFVIRVYYPRQIYELLFYALVSIKIQNTYNYQIHNLG
jgi:hypothetical protein